MADKLKNNDDLKLEALFRSEPLPDDGFSGRVVRQVRQRMWVRRLTLPTAIAVGAIIAAKPVMQLLSLLPKVIAMVPLDSIGVTDAGIGCLIQAPTILLGAMLLGALLMIGRMLEE